MSVRQILVGLALAFTAYMAARGLWWVGGDVERPVQQPVVIVLVLALFLATTWLTVLYGARAAVPAGGGDEPAAPMTGGVRSTLPIWICILVLGCAAILPSAIAWAVGEESRSAPYATWYIGGLGALMTIVMVRRRLWVAWIGTALLALGSSVWLGPLNALALGLVGSLVWVTVAQLVVISLDRAARDTARLADLQQAASAWQASQSGRQRARRVQVQRALATAGPILTRVVAQRGMLDQDAKTEARLAEGRLRDELRGPRLLDDEVRAALDAARRSGTVVTVLDEGGLDGLNEEALAIIRADLAETVRGAQSRRLYIRTSPHHRVAVTVVGRQEADGALSDDDAVDLWREIPHPRLGA